MLKEASRLLLDQLSHHVAENSAHGIETLIRGANVVEAVVVQKNLLHNENGHRLAELRSSLHDAEAQGNDLRRQQKVDDLGRVILNQRADDTKRCETQVLEGSRLGSGIKEGVQEQGNVR